MATRFAVATGNFSNTAIWDNGAVPTSSDDVYANNFTVTINGTYTVQTIRNTLPPVIVPNIATPAMTSNTTPSGVAFASSSQGVSLPWVAFNQDNNNAIGWQGAVGNSGILGYQFTSGKIIKRYVIKSGGNAANVPTAWTFQGSNDGITYTTLETIISGGLVANSNYTSGILANTNSYTYYRLNITSTQGAATPFVAEFEMTESTSTVLGATVGGQFIYANGGNLTCTASPAIFAGTSTPVLEMTLPIGNSAIFSGNVLTLTNLSPSSNAIRLSGTGTLTCTGNYTVDNGAALKQILYVTAAGTLNVIGNLSSTFTSTVAIANALRIDANATVNITGDIASSGGTVNTGTSATVYATVASTLNITGNIVASSYVTIYTAGSTINIIGNITGGTSVPSLFSITGASTISVTGITTAGSTQPAILASFAYTTNAASGTLVKVSANVVNTNGIMAIIAPRITVDVNAVSWLFQGITSGNITLYGPGTALGNPATYDVRFGTTYGPIGELTGTLRVPTAANVLSGVLVDNTTGTLLMTPAQFWNYLIASGFTANSIGDRLQNASTVATTGGQIASYNI